MKRNDLGFATKVWGTGVLIPAVLWGLEGIPLAECTKRFSHDLMLAIVWVVSEVLHVMALAVFYSTLFSLPSWLLLWAAASWLNRKSWQVREKKIMLSLLSSTLVIGAFGLLKIAFPDHVFVDPWSFALIVSGYFASICIGIWCFDLEGRGPKLSNEPLDQIPESRHDINN